MILIKMRRSERGRLVCADAADALERRKAERSETEGNSETPLGR